MSNFNYRGISSSTNVAGKDLTPKEAANQTYLQNQTGRPVPKINSILGIAGKQNKARIKQYKDVHDYQESKTQERLTDEALERAVAEDLHKRNIKRKTTKKKND